MGARLGACCCGAWFALAAMAALGSGRLPVSDRILVDRIELNHYYSDKDASRIWSQFVFYVWSDCNCRHESVGYAIESVSKLTHTERLHTVIFIDDGSPVKISSSEFIETWTQYDRELDAQHGLRLYSSDAPSPPRPNQ